MPWNYRHLLLKMSTFEMTFVTSKHPQIVAFGKRIRTIRKQKGISQEKLALLAQIDRSDMGKIERGEFNLTLTKIYQISEALQVSVVTLFQEDEFPPPT